MERSVSCLWDGVYRHRPVRRTNYQEEKGCISWHCQRLFSWQNKGEKMEDRRIQKTKSAILEAFISLILEKDIPKITVSEIARRANIDRKTFYLHYDTTDAVIHEFIKNQVDELIDMLELKDFFNNIFDVSILFQALNILMEKNINLYRHIANSSLYNFLSEEIKKVIKTSFWENLRARVNISPQVFDLYAEFYSAGTMAVYLKWLRKEVAVSEDQLSQIAGNATYYGFQQFIPRNV